MPIIDAFDENGLTGPVMGSGDALGLKKKVKKKKAKFGIGLAQRAREVGTLRPTLSSISTPLEGIETTTQRTKGGTGL